MLFFLSRYSLVGTFSKRNDQVMVQDAIHAVVLLFSGYCRGITGMAKELALLLLLHLEVYFTCRGENGS